MRCSVCGSRMYEEQRDTLFRGKMTLFGCRRCGESFKKFDDHFSLSSLFLSKNRGNERILRRADPVSFGQE